VSSRADAVAPSTGIDLATAAAAAPQEVLKRLGSRDSGLSASEAAGRLGRYGPNVAAAAAIGIVLPFTGLSHVRGFTPLPAAFFLVLVVLIVAYIVLVDVAKAFFYRAHGARPAVPGAQPSVPSAQASTDTRSVRRLHRRAAPFIVHALTGPGRWFLRPAGSDGKDRPPSASAGRDHRAGANHR
jgi:hypothetical protein